MKVRELTDLLRFANQDLDVVIRVGDDLLPVSAYLEGKFKELQRFELRVDLPEGAVVLKPTQSPIEESKKASKSAK